VIPSAAAPANSSAEPGSVKPSTNLLSKGHWLKHILASARAYLSTQHQKSIEVSLPQLFCLLQESQRPFAGQGTCQLVSARPLSQPLPSTSIPGSESATSMLPITPGSRAYQCLNQQVSCSGLCALRAGIPKNSNLTHVGYVTNDGTVHTAHFAHGGALGSLTQLRSVVRPRTSSSLTQRWHSSGNKDEGGVVADYYFNDINRGVWNELQTGIYGKAGEANDAGDFIESVMWNANSLAACVSDYDSGKDSFHGVVSIGWNDK
jgi:hypothetical protein